MQFNAQNEILIINITLYDWKSQFGHMKIKL